MFEFGLLAVLGTIRNSQNEESLLDVEELVLLALGSALGVLLVAALVLGVVRLRRPAQRQDHAKKCSPIITVATPSSNVEDDRNPDVVPQKDVDSLTAQDVDGKCCKEPGAPSSWQTSMTVTPINPQQHHQLPRHTGMKTLGLWEGGTWSKNQDLSTFRHVGAMTLQPAVRPRESAV